MFAFTFSIMASSRPVRVVGRPTTVEVAARTVRREEKIIMTSRSV